MRASLPILCGLLLSAAAGGALALMDRHHATDAPTANAAGSADAAEFSGADGLLAEALSRLAGHESIAAKVRQRTSLFDQEVVAVGSYLEGPPEAHLVRLELRIQLGQLQGSAQQVSDGAFLWSYQRLGDKTRLSRIDLRQLLAARQGRAGDPSGVGAGSHLLGFEGLRGLLAELNESFAFDEPKATVWGEQPVWELHGRWRPERLALLAEDPNVASDAGNVSKLARLPVQVPHEVVLFMGRDDLFPYRIEYRRQASGLLAKLPWTPSSHVISSIEWFDVTLDVPIDVLQFTYNAGDHPVSDMTAELLKRHGLPAVE